MPVPLLDLKRQYDPLRSDMETRLHEVVESQQFILGPGVERFEETIRQFCGAGCAIGMSSGTDAQLAALMALEIGPGDAVITTPYTFFATAGCISRVGGRPVFVDIDPQTYNLSPAALADYLHRAGRDCHGQLRTTSGERIRAIIPVHLFGLCADMDPILRLGREFNLPVLEDASQALGAEYLLTADGTKRPTRAGAMGEMNWFSFFPSKNLGAFGDGGMTICRDKTWETRLRSLRMHGMEAQYFHRFVGGNFRLDAIQAAVLAVKLPHLDAWSDGRRANATYYREAFGAAGLSGEIALPVEPYAGQDLAHHHIYNQYVIRVADGKRDALRAHLTSRGIGNAIYYPLALHEQECFRPLGYSPGDFPHAETAARETLALPVFPELTRAELDEAAAAVLSFYS